MPYATRYPPKHEPVPPTRKGFRRCQRCQLNRALRFFKPRGRICATCRKHRVSHTSRDQRLRDTYNISQADYEAMVKAQGGVCAGCGGSRRVFDVDHDHKREKTHGKRASVRGALCRSDNKVLAYVRDNPARLRALANYLEDPPAPKVLGPIPTHTRNR